ncbi:LTA synthase family protein [Bacillus haynesii]|uniref:LTA synthase family protein n=1 Tax=Bacillus haynesii TaxID=1925021 RepID=UPI003990BBF5
MRHVFARKNSFLLIALLLMTIKTYIVYKTSFDLKTDNILQEFILLINPISFLLFIFGIGLFMKERNRNHYIIGADIVLTFVLISDMVYCRFYNDFLTFPVLFQSSNFKPDLGSSIFELFNWTDILLIVDIIVLIWLYKRNPIFKTDSRNTRKQIIVYYLIAVAVFFCTLGLAETQRYQLLTRSFDRELLVKNISIYNYHIYDGLLQSKAFTQRAKAESNNLTDVKKYIDSNYKAPNQEMKGIASGRNVIMISLESTQSFVINKKLNGQEIAPFLNDLIDKSYYFDNFYHQTGQGKTSDAEFIGDNGLYPLGRGAVFFTNPNNDYEATPEILKKYGYHSYVMHANNKSFWNRDLMYQSFGYNKFFDENSYDISEENSIGWGLKDKDFVEQSVHLMKDLPQPFYTKMITLTNHFPFELNEEDKLIDEYKSNSKAVNRYFPTVRYEDESIKQLFDKLKSEGLYENSIIILYGDHYGISKDYNEALSQFLGKEITPYEQVQLQRVPFIVHIPGVTDKKPQKISDPAGQIDMRATFMNLLGINIKGQIQFGHDLFAKDRDPFTVLRDGSFITRDIIYSDGQCYNRKTGKTIDMGTCTPFREKARQELNYSDQIIYGDLLRFNGRNK